MTAKEKAQQLVERFEGNVKYALIAVDEIIKAVPIAPLHLSHPLNYWKEVKQEIEKL
jgi:hypothetical protein